MPVYVDSTGRKLEINFYKYKSGYVALSVRDLKNRFFDGYEIPIKELQELIRQLNAIQGEENEN